MKGCRPYSKKEFNQVSASFQGRYALRDRALFILGSKTGFRISELRSLRVQDVFDGKQIADWVTVRKSAMKGKSQSRTVVLHPKAKAAIREWINEMKHLNWFVSDSFLFRSQMCGNRPITSSYSARILKTVFKKREMKGKLSTHSMRKHWADRMFSILGRDLFKLSRAMGHCNISSTIHYLSFRQEEIDRAVLSV